MGNRNRASLINDAPRDPQALQQILVELYDKIARLESKELERSLSGLKKEQDERRIEHIQKKEKSDL